MSAPASLAPEAKPLTGTQWLICVIASIGFAFDIYELLMMPLIVGPALQELAGYTRGTPEFVRWFGLLFYVPAYNLPRVHEILRGGPLGGRIELERGYAAVLRKALSKPDALDGPGALASRARRAAAGAGSTP